MVASSWEARWLHILGVFSNLFSSKREKPEHAFFSLLVLCCRRVGQRKEALRWFVPSEPKVPSEMAVFASGSCLQAQRIVQMDCQITPWHRVAQTHRMNELVYQLKN